MLLSPANQVYECPRALLIGKPIQFSKNSGLNLRVLLGPLLHLYELTSLSAIFAFGFIRPKKHAGAHQSLGTQTFIVIEQFGIIGDEGVNFRVNLGIIFRDDGRRLLSRLKGSGGFFCGEFAKGFLSFHGVVDNFSF
jgi:hypothetical protein